MSSALLLFVALAAPDVMCPDRRQHVLPLMFARPLTGVDYVVAKLGAIAAILFAFSFIPQVVLTSATRSSATGPRLRPGHLDVLWKVPVAVVLLALYYAVIGVAIASLTDRRIVAGAAVIGLFLVTSIAAGILGDVDRRGSPAAADQRPRLPLYLRDLVFLGTSTAIAARRASRTAACSPSAVRRRAADGSACCCAATGGWNDEPAPSGAVAPRPGVRADATVEVADVSVWFGQKVALSELSCSFGAGVTGLLGPNGAGKTTLMRAMTGMLGVNQGTVRSGQGPAPRPRRARPVALVPEDEAVPRGSRPASSSATSPTCTGARPRRARTRRSRRRPCSTSPTGGSTASARGCVNAPRSPPPW